MSEPIRIQTKNKADSEKLYKNRTSKKPPHKKIPKKITESYLHNAGLYYLQRYAASSGHFKTVMMRKVRKSCAHHTEQNTEDCEELVDKLVEKFKDSGLLDDDSYIRGMVGSLRRRGLSQNAIIQKLRAKNVETEQTLRYLQMHDESFANDQYSADLRAAVILARKKKLGPFALKPHQSEEMNKILGRFARAGFSYDIARKVLEMDTEEAEEILFG